MRIPIDVPPGLNSDDTSSSASPAFVDADNIRWRLGKPQTRGGFESVTASTLTGVCRAVFAWTDNSNILNIAFGTHSKLELYQGGMVYDITPSSGFSAGQIDGTGSTGYGTGAWGIGGYGSPSSTDYFPLTWSLAPLGQTLIASPRNQTAFQWSNVTGTPAAALTNAPANITHMIVARDFVFALGTNQESGGVFNPLCIRHSALRAPTSWTTGLTAATTSREYVLPGGGRIVAGREIARSILVWTNHSLWLGTYVGSVNQIWRFDQVGKNCGLIGPNAVAILNSTAFWISPDRQFHSYTLGGQVETVACPVREDFAENLAASQGDKVVASTIAEFSEVRFDYPDSRDGYENSRYLTLVVEGPDAGNWSRGIEARTAMVDAGPSLYPCGVTYGGAIYWHERGQSSDGSALSWSLTTSDTALQEDASFLVRQIWPDISGQVGPIYVTLYARDFPQGDQRTYGPHTIAPGDDKIDLKATGKFFAMELSGEASPSFARLGRFTFDVTPRGRR